MDEQVERGPLTWGQWMSWRRIVSQTAPTPEFSLCIPVPNGKTRQHVRAALNSALSRHQVLRTTFEPGADGIRPRQVLWRPDAERYHLDGDVGSHADAKQQLGGYDPANEWPFRAFLVHTADGLELLLYVEHIATDFQGLKVLWEDLNALLRGDHEDQDLAVVGRQPIDLARFETSPAGQRLNRRALAYRQLQVPRIEQFVKRIYGSSSAMGTRQVEGTLLSKGLHSYVRRLALTYRLPPSSVMFAAIARAFAKTLGLTELMFGMMTSNRHLPGVGRTVGSLNQSSLLPMAVEPGYSLLDLGKACRRATITAVRHAYFDTNQDLLKMRARGLPEIPFTIINVNLMDVHQRLFDDRDGRARDEQIVPEIRTYDAPSGAGTIVRMTRHLDGLRTVVFGDANVLPEEAFQRLFDLIEATLREPDWTKAV